MKRISRLYGILMMLVLVVVLGATPALAAGGNVGIFTVGSTSYSVNGQSYTMDAAPYVQDGRTFVPVRYVAEMLGISTANISYINGQVTLLNGSDYVQLTPGSQVMLVNGTPVQMDVPAAVVNGRVMLPVRWICTAFGVNVNWDDATKTLTVYSNNGVNQVDQGYLSQIFQPAEETVPPLTYPAGTNVTTENYQWQYNGVTYNWQVEIPDQLLDWDRSVSALVTKFYSSDGYTQQQMISAEPDSLVQIIYSLADGSNFNYTPWVNESLNSQFTGYLADRLLQQAKTDRYDAFHTAEFIQAFVGGAIPYKLTNNPELAAQTLVDNGDCKDKSILLASLLSKIGYQVALLAFPPPAGQTTGHMALGIVFSDNQIPADRNASYYPDNGNKYYFAETTEPNWLIGQISDQSLEQQGYVYPVN